MKIQLTFQKDLIYKKKVCKGNERGQNKNNGN
jgi:hypothetical protein